MTQKIIMLCGIPGSGKSTWAKEEVAKDPNNWIRINNDDIRAMINNSVFSKSMEKFVNTTRMQMIILAVENNKNVIVDNLNLNSDHFNDVVDAVKNLNRDIIVEEMVFYVPLNIAIERNSGRTGTAKLEDKVVIYWWNKSGKESFQNYIPRVKEFKKQEAKNKIIPNKNLPKAAIFDLDGTMCNISHRDPYDASKCEEDGVNEHVLLFNKLLYYNDVKIFFVSGRHDTYRQQTMNWLDKNLPYNDFDLFMRKAGDFRKDSIIKEEIFNEHINGKYNIVAVVDDRLQVCRFWHSLGLPIFRVGDPDANF